jgi:hypothetical protein
MRTPVLFVVRNEHAARLMQREFHPTDAVVIAVEDDAPQMKLADFRFRAAFVAHGGGIEGLEEFLDLHVRPRVPGPVIYV